MPHRGVKLDKDVEAILGAREVKVDDAVVPELPQVHESPCPDMLAQLGGRTYARNPCVCAVGFSWTRPQPVTRPLRLRRRGGLLPSAHLHGEA